MYNAQYLTHDSSSRQSSQSLFDAQYFIILIQPFFSSFNFLSAAFGHGVNVSVSFKWHGALLSFLLNLPWINSLALSDITADSTLSCSKRRDSHGFHFLASLGADVTNKNQWQKTLCVYCIPQWMGWQTMYQCTQYMVIVYI